MRRDHERRMPPFQKNGGPVTSFLDELSRRRLDTLDDCRVAWERAASPAALCAAVVKAETDGGLPPWLADALLLLLVMGGDLVPSPRNKEPLLCRLWRWWNHDRLDAARAAQVACTRGTPPTMHWPTAYAAAAKSYADDALREGLIAEAGGAVGGDKMRESYKRVRRLLSTNPGIYRRCADVVAPRVGAAIQRQAEIIRARRRTPPPASE